MTKQNEVELDKQRESTKIEVEKFQQMVDALGAQTIESMASAGNNHQIKMLQLGCPIEKNKFLKISDLNFGFIFAVGHPFPVTWTHFYPYYRWSKSDQLTADCCWFRSSTTAGNFRN